MRVPKFKASSTISLFAYKPPKQLFQLWFDCLSVRLTSGMLDIFLINGQNHLYTCSHFAKHQFAFRLKLAQFSLNVLLIQRDIIGSSSYSNFIMNFQITTTRYRGPSCWINQRWNYRQPFIGEAPKGRVSRWNIAIGWDKKKTKSPFRNFLTGLIKKKKPIYEVEWWLNNVQSC